MSRTETLRMLKDPIETRHKEAKTELRTAQTALDEFISEAYCYTSLQERW